MSAADEVERFDEAEIADIMQLDIAEDTSNTGKKEYLAKCSELKIVPIAMFIAKLDCEHINLRHHGMTGQSCCW